MESVDLQGDVSTASSVTGEEPDVDGASTALRILCACVTNTWSPLLALRRSCRDAGYIRPLEPAPMRRWTSEGLGGS
jgi:hypothetical protein